MRVIESRLSAEDRVVLSAAPTAQADRIKGCRGIAEVRLWPLPYETWFQRVEVGDQPLRQLGAALQRISAGALWRGRVRHLEGKFTGESNALLFYGKARPLDREIDAMAAAVRGVESGPVKPGSQRQIDPAAAASASVRAIAVLAKQNAGYWLGLTAFEQGRTDPRKYAMAVNYLAGGTLDRYPDGPWTPGAKYNLGRVYEAQKNYARAIRQYRDDTGSAQSYGDQLRARWLAKLTGVEPPALPGLPIEKEAAKKEGPAKKEAPSREVPKVVPSAKEKPGIPDLPGLPGLPVEKEPPKKAAPPKKESPPKEVPKAVPPRKDKPGVPDLPVLPGLPDEKEPSKSPEKAAPK
jgi:hypothetical protein